MKKLAKTLVLAAIAMITITGCKKLPDFSSSNDNSGTYSDYYYGDEMSFTTSGETSKY